MRGTGSFPFVQGRLQSIHTHHFQTGLLGGAQYVLRYSQTAWHHEDDALALRSPPEEQGLAERHVGFVTEIKREAHSGPDFAKNALPFRDHFGLVRWFIRSALHTARILQTSGVGDALHHALHSIAFRDHEHEAELVHDAGAILETRVVLWAAEDSHEIVEDGGDGLAVALDELAEALMDGRVHGDVDAFFEGAVADDHEISIHAHL